MCTMALRWRHDLSDILSEKKSISSEVVCVIEYLSLFLALTHKSASVFMHVHYGDQKLKDEIVLTQTMPKSFSSSTICHAWRMNEKKKRRRAHHKYLIEKQRHQKVKEEKKHWNEKREFSKYGWKKINNNNSNHNKKNWTKQKKCEYMKKMESIWSVAFLSQRHLNS